VLLNRFKGALPASLKPMKKLERTDNLSDDGGCLEEFLTSIEHLTERHAHPRVQACLTWKNLGIITFGAVAVMFINFTLAFFLHLGWKVGMGSFIVYSTLTELLLTACISGACCLNLAIKIESDRQRSTQHAASGEDNRLIESEPTTSEGEP